VIARIRRPVGAAALVVMMLALGVGPVAAADPVTFGTPSATSTFAISMAFDQPVVLASAPTRVEILISTPGSAGPNVVEVEPPTSGGNQRLHFALELTDGHLVPNTTFVVRWRVTGEDGLTYLGPEVKRTYVDDRVTWKTLEGDIVRVHWYDGGDAFGERALRIGDKAVADGAKLLGVTETEPIDFYIYADQDKFYDALGPGTRENVGGQAHAEIRTMFALITPAEIDDTWVDVVVPHELTHLVFATAIDNPYHEPPHWLNEGLAVYLSEGFTSSDRALVTAAVTNGTIMPLEGLAGAFPTTRDRFFLSYAESVSAVDHIVGTYGRDALVKLIRSYATGVTDDEAFSAALGVDLAAFEAEWLKGLGAATPVRHGPKPAPPGPVPEGWSGAAPNPSLEPGSSQTPVPGSGLPGSPDGGSLGAPLIAILVAGGLIAVAIVLVIRMRRQTALADPRPPVDPAPPAKPPDPEP
jgi:hypothetical protein